jgi:hypothetical protein
MEKKAFDRNISKASMDAHYHVKKMRLTRLPFSSAFCISIYSALCIGTLHCVSAALIPAVCTRLCMVLGVSGDVNTGRSSLHLDRRLKKHYRWRFPPRNMDGPGISASARCSALVAILYGGGLDGMDD